MVQQSLRKVQLRLWDERIEIESNPVESLNAHDDASSLEIYSFNVSHSSIMAQHHALQCFMMERRRHSIKPY